MSSFVVLVLHDDDVGRGSCLYGDLYLLVGAERILRKCMGAEYELGGAAFRKVEAALHQYVLGVLFCPYADHLQGLLVEPALLEADVKRSPGALYTSVDHEYLTAALERYPAAEPAFYIVRGGIYIIVCHMSAS